MKEKESMSLSLISKYRTPLMGVAMLLVFFSHLPNPINHPLVNFLQWNGHFGVDIFVLLSGMGLFFSYYKDSSLGTFYTKRLIRILPFYIFINLAYLLTPGFISHNSFPEILATITTIGYWFHYGYCDWFIPHLLLMYLSFPLFYHLIKRLDCRIVLGLILIGWITISLLPIMDALFYRAAYRWVVFVLGVLLGKFLCGDSYESVYKRKLVFFSLLSAGVGIIMLFFFFARFSDMSLGTAEQILFKKGYIYMPYLLIVVGFSLICSIIFERCRNSKIGTILIWGSNIIGSMSLELYLVHIWFIPYAIYLFQRSTPSFFTLAFLSLLIISSFPVAYLLHLLNENVTNILRNNILGKRK